jgi:zinc D-Ala-D-Ala dipeptidase
MLRNDQTRPVAAAIQVRRTRRIMTAHRSKGGYRKKTRPKEPLLSAVSRPSRETGLVMRACVPAAAALLLSLSMATPRVAGAQAPVPAGFVDAATVVDGLVVDMRYFGDNNFVGARIDGYERPRCLLSIRAAQALARIQRDLRPRGLGLKVFDCYRPVRAVAHFIRWARRVGDLKRKAEFYPDIDKRDLFRLGYISVRSGHSRGSTVDLTLVQLADKAELDMGTIHDFAGRQSWISDRSVSAQAQRNRALLVRAMVNGGFRPYHKEWWHFTLANEPFPDSYFDFPVR